MLSKSHQEETVQFRRKLTPREINFVNPLPVVLSKTPIKKGTEVPLYLTYIENNLVCIF